MLKHKNEELKIKKKKIITIIIGTSNNCSQKTIIYHYKIMHVLEKYYGKHYYSTRHKDVILCFETLT